MKALLKSSLLRPLIKCSLLFAADALRFAKWSGSFNHNNREAALAKIIMTYHQVEKGLTMPQRRYGFGRSVLLELCDLVDEFERIYDENDPQVLHARGCVMAYLDMHKSVGYDFGKDRDFERRLHEFVSQRYNTQPAFQSHVTRETFYEDTEAAFPVFAAARHTSRHYKGVLELSRLEQAVSLSMTAPSACNRQHTRVHCVSDHSLRDKILDLQNGNRGFGGDADKLLVLTGDLRDIRWDEERNDIYTNVGIFLMNLSYALFYYRIAHCILNWSSTIPNDKRLREVLGLPDYEVVVAILACGNSPDEFDVAESPRKDYHTIFFNH